MNHSRGYTLIELIIAVGLFAVIMTLASGGYLLMIGLNRQTQGIATGIDNLSFALEVMTREIRTGSAYSCGLSLGRGDCASGGTSFTFTPVDSGSSVTYRRETQVAPGGASVGALTKNGAPLTDPSVDVQSVAFYVTGTTRGDSQPPHVTMVVTGVVAYGAGRTQTFAVETGATMRSTDI